jgi:uncharacterized membrane protein YoaK (UPF0700 family)
MPVSLYLQEHTERTRRSHHPGPRWLLIAAVVLAMNAGFINVVCLLGTYHVPVSHMTGAASHLSTALVTGDSAEAVGSASILISFLAGSILCGVVIGGIRLMPGRHYGIGLGIQALLLGLATWSTIEGHRSGVYLAAAACGMQNALATTHAGLVLRTTHVTGIVTDLGILIGHWLRHRRLEPWKLGLLSGLVLGFLGGGVAGTLAVHRFGPKALGLAAGLSALAAVIYLLWQARRGAVRATAPTDAA